MSDEVKKLKAKVKEQAERLAKLEAGMKKVLTAMNEDLDIVIIQTGKNYDQINELREMAGLPPLQEQMPNPPAIPQGKPGTGVNIYG